MRKYLKIKFLQTTFEVDLDVIKKYHVKSLSESNKINFGIERSNLIAASKVTEALFSNDNYAINWINRNLKWQHISKYLIKQNDNTYDYNEEWNIANKVIVSY